MWKRRKTYSIEEIWSLFEKTDSCWIWNGTINKDGYGNVMVKGERWYTHRLAWTLTNGEIPVGLKVLHRCDNPPCGNPAHLFLGTQADNVRDMCNKKRDVMSKRTHCPQGHAYSLENTRYGRSGSRYCVICKRAKTLEWIRRHRNVK